MIKYGMYVWNAFKSRFFTLEFTSLECLWLHVCYKSGMSKTKRGEHGVSSHVWLVFYLKSSKYKLDKL